MTTKCRFKYTRARDGLYSIQFSPDTGQPFRHLGSAQRLKEYQWQAIQPGNILLGSVHRSRGDAAFALVVRLLANQAF